MHRWILCIYAVFYLHLFLLFHCTIYFTLVPFGNRKSVSSLRTSAAEIKHIFSFLYSFRSARCTKTSCVPEDSSSNFLQNILVSSANRSKLESQLDENKRFLEGRTSWTRECRPSVSNLSWFSRGSLVGNHMTMDKNDQRQGWYGTTGTSWSHTYSPKCKYDAGGQTTDDANKASICRNIAREFVSSESSVCRIIHRDLGLFPYNVIKESAMIDLQLHMRMQLMNWAKENTQKTGIEKGLFSEAELFYLDGAFNVQNDTIWVSNHREVDAKGGTKKKHKFFIKIMVCLAACCERFTKPVIWDNGISNHDPGLSERVTFSNRKFSVS